jgi:hypothetical protein
MYYKNTKTGAIFFSSLPVTGKNIEEVKEEKKEVKKEVKKPTKKGD